MMRRDHQGRCRVCWIVSWMVSVSSVMGRGWGCDGDVEAAMMDMRE